VPVQVTLSQIIDFATEPLTKDSDREPLSPNILFIICKKQLNVTFANRGGYRKKEGTCLQVKNHDKRKNNGNIPCYQQFNGIEFLFALCNRADLLM
jgi:hypothetical protein